jgi:DNA-binding NarL/FixJ family response regulator
MLRILLADDHTVVRRATRLLIEGHWGWEVCAEAKDGREALDLAILEQPDIAIVDVTMPILDGLALTEQLLREASRTRVLLFTMHGDDATVHKALAAGARGFVLKDDGSDELTEAIAALDAGRRYVSSSISAMLLENTMNDVARIGDRFTHRELEVTQLICDGLSNKGMAKSLGVSLKTVESHRAAAMRKADAHTAADLVRFALRHRIING